MAETNECAGGTKSASSQLGRVRVRLIWLAVVGFAGLLLVTWLKTETWRQLERLQNDFAARNTQTYFLGIRLQAKFEQANRELLREQLSKGGPAAADRFHARLEELRAEMRSSLPRLSTARETAGARALDAALTAYQAEAEALLLQGLKAVRRNSAKEVAGQIETLYAPLHGACEELIQAQKTAWTDFLRASEATADKLQAISLWSAGLQLILLLAVAALMNRAFIVPLQARLNASQALLERQEKLAALGTLAAGVAHEIRNPLTAIKFRLFSLRKSLPREGMDHEDLQVIGSELHRLERIVKEVLQFARPAEPELGDVPAGPLMEEVRKLLAGQFAAQDIQILVEAAEPLVVRADRQQILQVLINLAQNAAESIGRDGVITLRVRRAAARARNGRSQQAILEVADTGKGIPPEVEQRLFDPFFSTKAGGTGLGLCIAARIVGKHDGTLTYQTALNRGTTFQLALPCANHHASQNPAH